MNCPRCGGLMTGDWFLDLQDDTGRIHFEGQRCLVCGEVLDPVILHNRRVGPEGLPGRRHRRLHPAGIA